MILTIFSATYEVSIYTLNEDSARSYSSFYYSFIGSKGVTAEYVALYPGDRQEGEVGTWTFIDNTDIGAFHCISIRMGVDDDDGWLFNEVCSNHFKLVHIVHFIQITFIHIPVAIRSF